MTGTNDKNDNQDVSKDMLAGMGGLFEGVSGLLGRLSELAEKGEALKKASQFSSPSGKDGVASCGFSVSFARGQDGNKSPAMNIKPFKTVDSSYRGSANAKRSEDREPQVDVFEESDHLLVVAEMPGVAVENVHVDFNGNIMTLVGTTPRVRFHKSIELSLSAQPENVQTSINNGVVEIRINKP